MNQNDIEMARRLGFQPRSLIKSRPQPKDRWKLPVKYWIQELHFKRFGHVIGEKPVEVKPAPPDRPLSEYEKRRLEEEFFWEDYNDRNSDPPPKKRRPTPTAAKPAGSRAVVDSGDDHDVPF